MFVAGIASGRQLQGRAIDYRPLEAPLKQRPTEQVQPGRPLAGSITITIILLVADPSWRGSENSRRRLYVTLMLVFYQTPTSGEKRKKKKKNNVVATTQCIFCATIHYDVPTRIFALVVTEDTRRFDGGPTRRRCYNRSRNN